jgi:hypothetical protein
VSHGNHSDSPQDLSSQRFDACGQTRRIDTINGGATKSPGRFLYDGLLLGRATLRGDELLGVVEGLRDLLMLEPEQHTSRWLRTVLPCFDLGNIFPKP